MLPCSFNSSPSVQIYEVPQIPAAPPSVWHRICSGLQQISAGEQQGKDMTLPLGTVCDKRRINTANLFLMERLREGFLEAIERLVKGLSQEMYGVSLPFIFQVCGISV